MLQEVKWHNHYVLGNLKLNFEKPDGGIYNTIIFAGENGCGKTTILSTLSEFLNLGSFEPFEYLKYEVDGNRFKLFATSAANSKLGFHERENELTKERKSIYTNKNNNFEALKSDNDDIRRYGCVYSKARSGFRTDKVQATTTQQLDAERYNKDDLDNFTSIKQLLVDIDSQDNSDWMRISRAHSGETIDSFSSQSKLSRFQKAFDGFFDNVKFKEVDQNDSSEKKIIFTKYGRNISIDDLSTGEKQIVFRGAYLLKNSKNLSQGIVLIDEPELSMHPVWCEKIYKFYSDLLFTKNNSIGQLFIATHSERIISRAIFDNDALIVGLKDNHGVIEFERYDASFTLPYKSYAEICFKAFRVYSNDFFIQLYDFIQTSQCFDTVKRVDNYIKGHKLFNANKHFVNSYYTKPNGNTIIYQTLPTKIRNELHHGNPNSVSPTDLIVSTDLLLDICRNP